MRLAGKCPHEMKASSAKIIELKLEIVQPRLAAGGYQWIVKVTIINIYIYIILYNIYHAIYLYIYIILHHLIHVYYKDCNKGHQWSPIVHPSTDHGLVDSTQPETAKG